MDDTRSHPAGRPDPVARARADQADGWAAGDRPPVEDLLRRHPGLTDEDALVLVMAEVELRRARGDDPGPAEYRDRFPRLADGLTAQFDVLDWLAAHPTAGPDPTRSAGTRTGDLPAADGPDPDAPPGYAIAGRLGRGGMGVVYRARDTRLNRDVALKTVARADLTPDAAARFRAEAEVLAAIRHPHVVTVFEVGDHGGRPFLAMEFVPGGTLADWLRGRAPVPPAAAARVVGKVARGVAAAHALGVVHRDLKPANVLVAGPDADPDPKVADFGLAKRPAADLTRTRAVMGTPAYMAPEQAAGRARFVGPAADVWALGVVLFEALTGRRPFDGGTVGELLARIASADPAPGVGRGVPRDLRTVVARCLEKRPDDRYPTAADLADDLDRFARGEAVAARPVGPAGRAARWARRNPAGAAAAGLTAVAAVSLVAAGVSLGQRGEAVAARRRAEEQTVAAQTAEAEAGRLRDAERAARLDADRARETLARTEYGRTVNLAYREFQQNDLARAAEYLALCRPDLRGWEWHYVHRLCHLTWETIPEPPGCESQPWSADGLTVVTRSAGGAVTVRRVGGGPVRTIAAGNGTSWAAVSPDARLVATGDGRTLRLWDAATGAAVREVRHRQGIRSATFTPDGTRLVGILEQDLTPPTPDPKDKSVLAEAVAARWTVAAGAEPDTEWREPAAPVPVERPGIIAQMRLKSTVARAVPLPDGQLLTASALFDAGLWSTDGRSRTPVAGVGLVFAVDPKHGTLVASGRDQNLCGVRIGQAQPDWSFPVGTGDVTALGVHADGDALLVGFKDGRVERWSISDKKRRATFPGFQTAVQSCRLSADGQWVVAGAAGEMRVWRADQSAEPAATKIAAYDKDFAAAVPPKAVTGPRFRFEYRVLRAGDYTLESLAPGSADVSDLGGGFRALRDATISRRFGPGVVFTPGRASLILAGSVWRDERTLLPGRTLNNDRIPDSHVAPVFCHDRDDLLAVVDKKSVPVRLVSLAVPAADRRLGNEERATAGGFARGGRTLYLGAESGRVSAWDPDAGTRLWATDAAGGAVTCVDASADGRLVAVGGADGRLRLRDAATGREVASLLGHRGEIQSVRFSPDGQRLASVAANGELKLWDPTSGQDVLTLAVDRGKAVDFSPDGARLVVANINEYGCIFARLDGSGEWQVKFAGVKIPLSRLPKIGTEYMCVATGFQEAVYDARPMNRAFLKPGTDPRPTPVRP